MSFVDEIRGFRRAVARQSTNDQRNISIALFNSIIESTPVDTGRLRSNWYASINSPSAKINAGAEDVSAALADSPFDVDFYFTNNLPYAIPIEEGHGVNNAPGGMVRVNIARFDQILTERARRSRLL